MTRRQLFTLFFALILGQTFAQTCRQVIGYCPNWQWYDRNHLVNPMSIEYEKYSILNYCFFRPQASGNIVSTDPWSDENLLLGQINWQTSPPSYVPGTNIPDNAHAAGILVLASIGGWNDSDQFPAIAASATKRAIFALDCVQLCAQYDFDGVDIDWEYPGYEPHGGSPSRRGQLHLAAPANPRFAHGLRHGQRSLSKKSSQARTGSITAGTSLTAKFKPGFSGSPQNEHWRLWVDWNRDGDFADADELCFTVSGSTTDTITQNFNAPPTVSNGYCRIRLSMKRTSPAGECDVFSNGEVEDYGCLLQNPQTRPGFARNQTANQRFSGFALQPNPATERVKLKFVNPPGQVDKFENAPAEISIINAVGQTVLRRSVLAVSGENIFEIEIGDLPQGIYQVVLQNCGERVAESLVVLRS